MAKTGKELKDFSSKKDGTEQFVDDQTYAPSVTHGRLFLEYSIDTGEVDEHERPIIVRKTEPIHVTQQLLSQLCIDVFAKAQNNELTSPLDVEDVFKTAFERELFGE